MSTAARWSVVVAVVVLGLAAAMWSTLSAQPDPLDDGQQAGSSQRPGIRGPYQPATQDTREAAGLPACPSPAAGPATGTAASGAAAAALDLVCMADGTKVSLAAFQGADRGQAPGAAAAPGSDDGQSSDDVQGNRPLLVNLWAYWCEPCRRELPALQEAQQRLGDRVQIVLVHIDPAEGRGIDMLRELAITELPALEDPDGRVATTVGAPPVVPASVLIAPDGTVAAVHVETMDTVDHVEAVVNKYLGEEGQR